jgi:uncharacterized protein (TIGR03067 family)
MRVTTLLLLLGTGLVPAAEPASKGGATGDSAKLQGTWSIVSVEINGLPLDAEKLKDARLSIQGNRYSFRLEDTRLEFTFKVDASKSPKAIDLMVVEGSLKGKVFPGIYKLENGGYTICRATVPGKDRPTIFAAPANSGLMLVVWKRAARPLTGAKGAQAPANDR